MIKWIEGVNNEWEKYINIIQNNLKTVLCLSFYLKLFTIILNWFGFIAYFLGLFMQGA